MEDFPANPNRNYAGKAKAPVEKPAEEARPKIEKIVDGEVLRRKKPLGKRMRETFIGADAGSVFHFVMMDVLVPAAKDMAADAVSQGIERMLFGEVKSASRRGGHRPSTTGYRYDRPVGAGAMFGGRPMREDPRPAPSLSRRSRAVHNFDEIILPTRVAGEDVIDGLFELVSKFEVAKVADLYDMVGITGDYTDHKWGWTDLRGAGVTRVRSGYLLDLPRPEPLD